VEAVAIALEGETLATFPSALITCLRSTSSGPLYASTRLPKRETCNITHHSNTLPNAICVTLHESTSNQSDFPDNETPAIMEATPRVNAKYLEQFSHQNVRIMGKVRQIRGDSATIDADGDITIHLNRVSSLPNS